MKASKFENDRVQRLFSDIWGSLPVRMAGALSFSRKAGAQSEAAGD